MPNSAFPPQPLRASPRFQSHIPVARSPIFSRILDYHGVNTERAPASRADATATPKGFLGVHTEAVRQSAIESMLDDPVPRCPPAPFQPEPSLALQLPFHEARDEAQKCARELLPLLPQSSIVEMAGGKLLYARTPAAELQQANFRTVCKAVGRKGADGPPIPIPPEQAKSLHGGTLP